MSDIDDFEELIKRMTQDTIHNLINSQTKIQEPLKINNLEQKSVKDKRQVKNQKKSKYEKEKTPIQTENFSLDISQISIANSSIAQQNKKKKVYRLKASENNVIEQKKTPIPNKQPQRVKETEQNQSKTKKYVAKSKLPQQKQLIYSQPLNNNKYQSYQQYKPQQYKQKIIYENKCQKLLKNYEQIQQNQEQLENEIRKIKKYFFLTDISASYSQKGKDIRVMKCLDYPILFISYYYKNQKRYMRIKQIQRTFKNKIYSYYQIIKKIYDLYFLPVDICYEEALMDFVQVKAKQIKLKLVLKKQFREDQGQIEKLFYYNLNKNNTIQFIFFDQNMNDIAFSEHLIKQNKDKYNQSYEAYMSFARSVKKQNMDIVNMGEEEVQSQEEETIHVNQQIVRTQDIKTQLPKIQNRLNQLLSRDLTNLEAMVQTKNNQLMEMMKNDYKNNPIASNLEDQIDRMNRNLENFKQIRQEIQIKLKGIKNLSQTVRYQTLRLYSKRMILADRLFDSKLPILSKKTEIFEMLNKKNLIIIEGQTGSGKSTQLPQLLCEYYKLFQNAKAKPVLITQPRKIATRSLAERVAQEMQQKVGQFIDYAASSNTITNPEAKIIFKLDRIVLDQLVSSPTLDNYSCMVIDEAHERTISIDVILGLTKELLKKRTNFKVIVTSASMDITLFQKYFSTTALRISGRLHPVDIIYRPSREEDTVKKIQNLMQQELLSETGHLKNQYKGHILVFCADTLEIDRLCQIFIPKLNPKHFLVLPLHGKLLPQQQKRVFYRTKEHKIIFANRIAQTAITIDGVKVVIDSGFDRQMHYDQTTKFSSMRIAHISQSSAKQRAGRAGRTQQGICFRLYSEKQFRQKKQNKNPQIRNMALDTLVLRLKSLRIKDIFQFSYLEAPEKLGMQISIDLLKLIGCLDSKEQITKIGQFLVKIPIQPFLARAIIQGLILEKTTEIFPKFKDQRKQYSKIIIQILCLIMNANNLFRISKDNSERGDQIKYQKFSHQKGDFFFLRKIYQQFIYESSSRGSIRNWLMNNYLFGKTLYQIRDLVRQIEDITKYFSIKEQEMEAEIQTCKLNLQKYKDEEDLILSCLTTSFCANLALYSGNSRIGYTLMSDKRTIQLYGTSCLSLLGIAPKWILVYDLYENKDGKMFCRVANQISFDFLKNTVDPYVLNKFKVNQAQKSNPFYKQVSYKLQTMLYSRLKNQANDRYETSHLKQLNLDFNDFQNKITAFLVCDYKDRINKSDSQKNLQEHIENLRKKVQNNFKHNYIGNIFVTLGNGIQINKIQFNHSNMVYEITNFDNDTYNNLCNNLNPNFRVQTYGKQKVKVFIQSQEQIQQFQAFLNYLKQFEGKKIVIKKQLIDIRKKVPQTKIYLTWFAGKSDRQNVLLLYRNKQRYGNNSNGQDVQLTEATSTNLRYIQEAVQSYYQNQTGKDRKRRQKTRGSNNFGRLSLTKKGNGININNTTLDEIQIYQFLTDLIKKGKINYGFKMPDFIKKFREPQRPDCQRTQTQWERQIKDLIQPLTNKIQNCIRVWGYKYFDSKKDKKLTAYQSTFKVDWKAQIRTFDIKLLNKMKNQYDGKKYLLGCQKLHITSMFDQCIIIVDNKVFDRLNDQYLYNVQNFEAEYPGIIFDVYDKRSKKNYGHGHSRKAITVKSQNRQDLIKPMRTISELFTPKYLIINDREFRYLDSNSGGKILDWIEQDEQFKIYFGFDRYQKRLKLYCHDSLTKKIQSILRARLRQCKFYDQLISYRGRNLKRIENILLRKKEQLQTKNQKDKFLVYEKRYSTRQIFLYADPVTFEDMKKQILKVEVNQNDCECQICNDIMDAPYKLYNCHHSFCWACLSSEIRQFKVKSGSKLLQCSHYDEKSKKMCGKEINIHDVSTILSEQELQKICDIKISSYVQSNDKYFHCLSSNCEMIFDRDQIEREDQIDCQLCGKNYCLRCQNSHKNYTCEQWRNRNDLPSNDSINKLGIKICPKCKRGIQKNGGCNHIACKCGAHLCWKCLKNFQVSKDCYDHLAKQCGGIFDAGVQ